MNPTAVAVNPDGTRAYVTSYFGKVSVIDTDQASTSYNKVIATIGVGGFPYGLATKTNIVTATIGRGLDFSDPYGVALNADGTRAFVTNTGSSELLVIDTATYALIATVRVRSTPEGVAVNPGGTKVYVANNGNSTVSVIDI